MSKTLADTPAVSQRPKDLWELVEKESNLFEEDVLSCENCKTNRDKKWRDVCDRHLQDAAIIAGKKMLLKDLQSWAKENAVMVTTTEDFKRRNIDPVPFAKAVFLERFFHCNTCYDNRRQGDQSCHDGLGEENEK